jgi:precorrin-6B methylase 2
MAYESIASHRTMALDAVRNRAYAHALTHIITPDSVVLDLGAGTGVLGLIAARLGAQRVYLVEPTDVIAVAQELVSANGLGDRVTCMHGRLEDIELPEQVDVIVSVMTGNFLVTEDLLPTLFRARDTALKPGGHLVPNAAVMEATIVSAPAIHETHVSCWSGAQQGIDTSIGRSYAANTVVYNSTDIRGVRYLAEPGAVHAVDFDRDTYAGVHAAITLQATEAGICHGIAGWFRMQLGDTWLSTSPRDERVHWSAVFFPIDPPLPIDGGEQVAIGLDREPGGEWSWRVTAKDGKRRQSTLLSTPMTEATLRKAAVDYVPTPSADGRAVLHVLSSMGAHQDVGALARGVHAAFPERYRTESDALAFVQDVVARYA